MTRLPRFAFRRPATYAASRAGCRRPSVGRVSAQPAADLTVLATVAYLCRGFASSARWCCSWSTSRGLGGAWARWRGGVRCARAPGLISVRGLALWRAGDVMGDGVFPRDAVRPLGLWRPSTRWWRQRHAGSRPRCIGVTEGRARTQIRLDGLERLVAEFAQGVEAALEQLAGQGEAGAIAAETAGGLVVVAAVGAARPAGGLGGLEQCPAERRRPLA